MKQNRLSALINEAGGITAFTRKMGMRPDFASRLREIVNGKRVPRDETRSKIIQATGGAITHEEIISIAGDEKPKSAQPQKVDEHWGADEGERRAWIASRAAAAARAQRKANEAVRR